MSFLILSVACVFLAVCVVAVMLVIKPERMPVAVSHGMVVGLSSLSLLSVLFYLIALLEA